MLYNVLLENQYYEENQRFGGEYDKCICVISGKIAFYVEGVEYVIELGKKLYLLLGVIHEAKNVWDEKITYLVNERLGNK